MIKKILQIFIFVISCLTTYAKQLQKTEIESVTNQSYLFLRKKAVGKDTLDAKKHIREWIAKAKKNNDFKEQVAAYKAMLYKAENALKMKYADSMVLASKKTSDNILIGSSYMTKATVYYGFQENKKALDNFILADRYIVKTKDNYAKHKVKYGIAQTKYLLGFYNEAIALFNECEEYFKEENDRAYLNTLHYLGLCYNRLKKYDLATAVNQLGLQEGLRLENPDMSNYFVHAEGVNQFGLENYAVAVANLSTTLPYFVKNKDFANQTIAYYYLGKSYLKLNKSEKALHYFKKSRFHL